MSDVTESVNMFAVNISNAELDFLRSNSRVVISRMYGKHTTVGDLAGELLQSRKRIAALESKLAAANESYIDGLHDAIDALPEDDFTGAFAIGGLVTRARIQEAQNG